MKRALVVILVSLGAAVAPAGALGAVGDLTFIGCIGDFTGCTTTTPANAVDGPSSFAISPDGATLYSAGEGSNALAVFSRNPASGALSYTSCIGNDAGCTSTTPADALEGATSVAISGDGSSVYAAGYGANALAVFSRSSATGALTYHGCIGDHTGCTTTTPAGALDGPESVAVSADGASVYVAAANANALDVFSRDPGTGVLTYTGCIGDSSGCTATTPSGALDGANAVAVSAQGNSVYVAGYTSNAVAIFSRNTSTHAVAYAGCIGEPSGCTHTTPSTALANAFSVVVSADGSSVYAGGFDTVETFSRNLSSGGLTFAGCIGQLSGCTPTSPAGAIDLPAQVTVSADGNSVYSVGGNVPASAISTFARNSGTGALTFTGCIGDTVGCTPTTPAGSLHGAGATLVYGASVYADGFDSGAINIFTRAVPPPVCTDVAGAVAFGTATSITLNCADADPVPLTFAVASGPAHGTLGAVASNGQLTYTPQAGYSGADSFTYSASDGQGSSNAATVHLTIAAGPTARPPSPQTTHSTLDDQRITLTSPSLLACTAAGKRLAVKLSSATIARSKAPKLTFESARFYLDKGIKHLRRHGKHKRVTYSANATVHHLPVALALALTGLKPGTHTLTVKLSFKRAQRKHGRSKTVPQTVSVKFKVC